MADNDKIYLDRLNLRAPNGIDWVPLNNMRISSTVTSTVGEALNQALNTGTQSTEYQAGAGLTLNNNIFSLQTTTVTPGNYPGIIMNTQDPDKTYISVHNFTVDAYGRLTAAAGEQYAIPDESVKNELVTTGTYYLTGTTDSTSNTGTQVFRDDIKVETNGAITIGTRTGTIGNYSFTQGASNEASGIYAHAEGYLTKAIGLEAHAEGARSEASGDYAHAEGYQTKALGDYAHAEGYLTQAKKWSHSEGYRTEATGENSHAEGKSTKALGACSHASGVETEANGVAQTVLGTFNITDIANYTTHPSEITDYKRYAVIVGNGTDSSHPSNAATLDWQGNLDIAGNYTSNGQSIVTTAAITSALGYFPNKIIQVTNMTPTESECIIWIDTSN